MSIKFCQQCDNMYYISISEKDSNKISYDCRNCGFKDDTIAEEGICVLNTLVKRGEHKFNHIINQYTKFDPKLPRLNNIPCPNPACESNGSSTAAASAIVKNEIIYIRYDDDNLKYVYICANCDATWKTDDTK